MKKFSIELLKMNKEKVTELFGINPDFGNQISRANNISYEKNDNSNKIKKGVIE